MLVNMKKMLEDARDNGYIVAAPNVWNDWSTRAALDAAIELNSPLILDIDYNSNIFLWISYAKIWAESAPIPVAINLDHGKSYEDVANSIHAGVTSVMLDKSHESFEVNKFELKRVVELASLSDVSVEGELGYVGDASESDHSNHNYYTDYKLVKEFVNETGIDCLAVAVGTAHGKYKDGITPEINFELINKIENETPIPLVLHGGSGTPSEVLRKLASETNISKVNLFTDIHEHIIKNTENLPKDLPLYILDNYYYLFYKEKLKEYLKIFGSNDRAKSIVYEKRNYYEGDIDIR